MKVAIYVDSENVHLNFDSATQLLELGKLKGSLITKKIYCNSANLANLSPSKSTLEKIGYQIVDVNCPSKNALDYRLKSDVIDDIYSSNSPDIFILVSGDGDFTNTVRNLRDKNKYVIVIAKQCNAKLKDVADEFYCIDELPKLVENKNQPQTNSISAKISYHEAVEYLVETIKKALTQHKPTNYSYLSKLMRRMFPKYQGIASISSPSGKKFKTFKQFVDMVVTQGKVTRQNQELFVI